MERFTKLMREGWLGNAVQNEKKIEYNSIYFLHLQ